MSSKKTEKKMKFKLALNNNNSIAINIEIRFFRITIIPQKDALNNANDTCNRDVSVISITLN